MDYNIDDEIDRLLDEVTDEYRQPKWVDKVQKVSGKTIKAMAKSKAIQKFGNSKFAKDQANKNVNRKAANQRMKVKAKVYNGEKLKPHEQKLWDDTNKRKKGAE